MLKNIKSALIIGIAFCSLAAGQAGAQSLNVAATVDAASCSFGTFTDVSFGTTIPAGVTAAEIPGSGTISITCTGAVEDAKVKMLGSNDDRLMFKDGNVSATDTITYQLRKPNASGAATLDAWGTDGTAALTTDLGTTATPINVHAAILAGQNPTAGTTYSAIVTVEVEV